MVIYELLRYACEIRVRRHPQRIVVTIEYDDPIVVKRIRPDEPLDGAEDPI